MDIPLSILDSGVFKYKRQQAYQVINSIFEEISIYENLGYKRYWLSEHFSNEFAWYSPEILLPLLSGYSDKIKIGWAGVLLNFHSPLLVANNFKLLSAIFDGRIDLGIAGANISPDFKNLIFQNPNEWNSQISQLCELIQDTYINPQGKEVLIPPYGTSVPDIWYLTTGGLDFEKCIENKMNLSLSLMHPKSNLTTNLSLIKKYKEAFYLRHGFSPKTVVLVPVVITENERIINVLTKHYQIDGFNGIFGSKQFIWDQFYELKHKLECDEFCLYNPYCIREKRMDTFKNIIL